jgi:hexokinase
VGEGPEAEADPLDRVVDRFGRAVTRRPDATHGDTSGMLPTWTTPFDRRVGNPNVANGTVAPWSFLS